MSFWNLGNASILPLRSWHKQCGPTSFPITIYIYPISLRKSCMWERVCKIEALMLFALEIVSRVHRSFICLFGMMFSFSCLVGFMEEREAAWSLLSISYLSCSPSYKRKSITSKWFYRILWCGWFPLWIQTHTIGTSCSSRRLDAMGWGGRTSIRFAPNPCSLYHCVSYLQSLYG